MKIDVLGLKHTVKSAGGTSKVVASARFTDHFYNPQGEIFTLWVTKNVYFIVKNRRILTFSCNYEKVFEKAESMVGKLTYHNPTK